MARGPRGPIDDGPPPTKGQRKDQLRRLLSLMLPHRGRFIIATFALLGGSGIALLYPQAARRAIDLGLSEGGDATQLNTIALIALVLIGVHAFIVWARHYLMSWLGERVVTDLRRQVYTKLLQLPPSWFWERRTGELTGRLASDVTVIQSAVGSELSISLRHAIQLVGGVVLLFIENARLTLIMLSVIPPLVLGVFVFGRKIRVMSKALQDRLAVASGRVDEIVSAIATVQSFTQEPRERDAYGGDVEDAFQQSLSLARWRAAFMATVTAAGFAGMVLILWVGGRSVIAGELSPGDLTAFLLYTMMVAASLGSLAGVWSSLMRAVGATERLYEILDEQPGIQDPAEPVALPDGGGAVAFKDLSFRYPSRPDVQVLDGIDLSIAPGQAVALVGHSGSGKSTLTSLLLRFFDPDEGSVELEGVDIRRLKLDALRSTLAIVAQEPVLFSGTLRENIAYGRPDATDAQVEAAARDAHAHAFIMGFPDGYDTIVGERGVKLSGGQRQRIAIARAIVLDPRVLILDEATSNLDAESEALVQEALARLMAGRTTLVVAHRLSTVRDADRIVVLDKGRLVESGTHSELMAAGGAYKKLVEHQVFASSDGDPPAINAAAPPLAVA
jgi:ABC transporter fused permease/ATP-binding protein